MKEPVKVECIELSHLRTDGGTQARICTREDVVQEYAEALVGAVDFPPIIVFDDGKELWVGDGIHRVGAYLKAGRTVIPCEIRQGTQQDARWHACGANTTHGLKRTNEDKRNAVRIALEIDESKSDNSIATHCGVSHSTVAAIRLSCQVGKIDSAEASSLNSTRTATRGGTTYPINTSNIGKKLCDKCSRFGAKPDCPYCEETRKVKKESPAPIPAEPEPASEPDEPVVVEREPGDDSEQSQEQETAEPHPIEAVAVDLEGHPVTPYTAEAFAAVEKFEVCDSIIRQLQKTIDEIAKAPGGEKLRGQVRPHGNDERIILKSDHLDALKRDLNGTRPHSICPYCAGQPTDDCKGCSGRGWVTHITWKSIDDQQKEKLAC